MRYTVVIKKKFPYFTTLNQTYCVLSPYFLLPAQRSSNVTTVLLPYVVNKKKVTREKSAASSEHYFCSWESVWGLQLQIWGSEIFPGCCYSSPKQTT